MPKPSRSPLYFYALEYQRRLQRISGQRMNINEAIAACYDEWKALPDEHKEPFKIIYEEWRLQYRADPEVAGVPRHPNKKQERQEAKNQKITSERDIPCEELKTHYDRFGLERDYLAFEYLPLDIGELLSMPIYIINFQTFCKVDEEDGGQFVPAEMCILRYTLAEGPTTFRHTFIKPEKIPPGYMSACLEHLKATHEIPLKDFAEASDNYQMIYEHLKSIVLPSTTTTNKNTMMMMNNDNDDRIRRRQFRLTRPCVFFPAVEYEQTKNLLDWLQEKAEGVRPTNETRLVGLASVESLIMLLAELKKRRVSRDDIHKTFENAAYSFMIEERCKYHFQLGISHCSVARCYASAKLIAAYLNQLYVPERPMSTISGQRSQATSDSSSNASNILATHLHQHSSSAPRHATGSQVLSSQYSSTGTSDSIASSYCPPEQRKQYHATPTPATIPKLVESSSRPPSRYPYQSQPQPVAQQQHDLHVSDELIHHPTIVKLQQQNFHRLLSNAASSASSSSAHNQPQQQQQSNDYAIEGDDQASYFSTAGIGSEAATMSRTNVHAQIMNSTERLRQNLTPNNERLPMPEFSPIKQTTSDTQRAVLSQRKQALVRALQSIDKQMEELNVQ